MPEETDVPLMAPIPMAGFLVPAASPALPSNFTMVTQPLDAGVPFTFALDRHWSVTLRYPTGVLAPWLDADPHAIASSDLSERAPFSPATPAPAGDPVRIVIALDGVARAVLPLDASRRAFAIDDGVRGAGLELAIISWTIAAGTVSGAGSFGSSLTLAWRYAAVAADIFATPPLQPLVALRLTRLVFPLIQIFPLESFMANLVDGELRASGFLPQRRLVRWQ